jgi:Na(+)-translocating NADH:ubiquinone oxidoreductase B subunit
MSGDAVWIAMENNFLADLFFEQHTFINGVTGATWLGQAAGMVSDGSVTTLLTEGATQASLWSGEVLQTAAGESVHIMKDVTGNSISIWDAFAGWIPGSIGETSTFACILGAIVLVGTGIGSWRVMVSIVLGGLAMGYLLNGLGSEDPFFNMPGWYHLFLGGFAFGLVYMATDPVTAAQTNQGKFIYGFLIGFIAVLVRVINPAYPEGMMLAILLMNVFAPLIDYFVVQGNIKRRLSRA